MSINLTTTSYKRSVHPTKEISNNPKKTKIEQLSEKTISHFAVQKIPGLPLPKKQYRYSNKDHWHRMRECGDKKAHKAIITHLIKANEKKYNEKFHQLLNNASVSDTIDWLMKLGGEKACVTKLESMVPGYDLTEFFFSYLFKTLTNLQTIRIYVQENFTENPFKKCQFTHLQSVTLTGSWVNDATISTLITNTAPANVSSLKEVTLVGNNFKPLTKKAFPIDISLKNVKKLHLSKAIRHGAIERCLKQIQANREKNQLRKLYLCAESLPVTILQGLSLHAINALQLEGVGEEFFKKIIKQIKPKILHLWTPCFTSPDIFRSVAESLACLKDFSLKECEIKRERIKPILSLQNLQKLILRAQIMSPLHKEDFNELPNLKIFICTKIFSSKEDLISTIRSKMPNLRILNSPWGGLEILN